MKRLSSKARVEAFTLIEVLVVIAIVGLFFLALHPTFDNRPMKATLNFCMNNQRQIAIGLLIWQSDNDGRFPWQVSTTNSGPMELIASGQALSQFRVLSNYVKSTSAFICPTDKAKRVATNYETMNDQDISYFVNVDASANTANTILTGDRHLQADGKPVKPGLFAFTNGMAMGWTRELHGQTASAPVGVLAFADGHGQIIRPLNSALTDVFLHQPIATNRLVVP